MSSFGDFVDITLFQVSVGDNIPNSWLLKIGHFPTPPLNFRALYFQTNRETTGDFSGSPWENTSTITNSSWASLSCWSYGLPRQHVSENGGVYPLIYDHF
jgi:hypothetical protein